MLSSLDKNAKDILKIENQKSLEIKLSQMKEENQNNDNLENEIIDTLVSELIAHGKDSNQIRQISQISKVLGQSLGLDKKYCDTLEQAAKIYDIGNIIVSRDVYIKEETLSFEEFEIIKQHTSFGANILSGIGFPSTDLGAIISKEHHEWWDGGGYPSGLKAEEIDIASRMIAIADTVGALFRKRPGRDVWDYKKILEHLKTRSAIQFDPDVLEVFLINKDVIHEILTIDLESVPSSWYM